MPESNSTKTVHRVGLHGGNDHARQELICRYATADDLVRFYGELPRETIRALVILVHGEPAAVIGLANRSDCATVFSDSKPEIEPYRKSMTVLRAIKKVMQMVKDSKRVVYALRQEETDTIVRLGFEHVKDEVYRWPQ